MTPPLMYLTLPLLPSAPPTSLPLPGTVEGGAKKRLAAPTLSVSLSHRGSADLHADGCVALSASPDETPSLDINLEALDTPSDSESGTLPDSLHDLEWEGETGCLHLIWVQQQCTLHGQHERLWDFSSLG